LNQQYPTTYSLDILNLNGNGNGKKTTLNCSTTIMLPLKKAKIVLRYSIGGEVLSNWPGGLASVGTDVGVVYGDE
jgi:hypothetical protein